MTRPSTLLVSTLDDPRRIELRSGEHFSAYSQRGATEDIIEISHDLTKLRRMDLTKMRVALNVCQQPAVQRSQHLHDRDYPLRPAINLPEPAIPDHSFNDLLRRRRSVREFSGAPLCQSAVSSLLYGAIGETARTVIRTDEDCSLSVSLRSIPSGGALHPTRIFVALLRESDLSRGLYHYHVAQHLLESVKTINESGSEDLLAALPIHPYVVDLTRASAIFFITSKFWRARAKYGARGYRWCLVEAGAACQNLSLTAVALGLQHVVLGGFYDDEIHTYLGIDGIDHAVILAVAVGSRHGVEESKNVEY